MICPDGISVARNVYVVYKGNRRLFSTTSLDRIIPMYRKQMDTEPFSVEAVEKEAEVFRKELYRSDISSLRCVKTGASEWRMYVGSHGYNVRASMEDMNEVNSWMDSSLVGKGDTPDEAISSFIAAVRRKRISLLKYRQRCINKLGRVVESLRAFGRN